MLLYTIVPEDVIFSQQCNVNIVEKRVNNEITQYSKQADGTLTPMRLISTNPRSFLNINF